MSKIQDKIFYKCRKHVFDQVTEQVWYKVWNQVWNQTGSKLFEKVEIQVWHNIENCITLRDQIMETINNERNSR